MGSESPPLFFLKKKGLGTSNPLFLALSKKKKEAGRNPDKK
jgi:hypothetical protein